MALPSISDAVNIRSVEDLKAAFGLIPIVIDDIIVDVIQNIDVEYSFLITQKPIEEGFVNDARIANPIKLSLDCIFTNNIENLSVTGIIKSAITGNFSLDTWKQKRDALLELKNENKVIKIVTPNKQYESMMIENISINENLSTGDSLRFTIDVREVNIVFTDTNKVDKVPQSFEDASVAKKTKKKSKKGAIRPKKTGVTGPSA